MTDIKVTIDNSLDDVKVFALENVLENVTAIEQAGEAAIESAEDAEAWAIGERNGVPVSADDETYQNNSKYYAESASVMASKFFVTDTASGAVASFSDGADDVPMDSVLCHINPTQSGTGDPSPENIRPISGYESVSLYHSGEDTSEYTTTIIQLGQTVYGGTLDVVSGVLTVDRLIADLGDIGSWTYNPTYNAFSTSSNQSGASWIDSMPAITSEGIDGLECTAYAPYYTGSAISPNNIPDKSVVACLRSWSSSTKRVIIFDSAYTDADTFKASLSGVKLVYPLATPSSVQLTPHEVDSLLGSNNLWHNCNGNIDVVYKADTKLYIDKRLAELS